MAAIRVPSWEFRSEFRRAAVDRRMDIFKTIAHMRLREVKRIRREDSYLAHEAAEFVLVQDACI